MGGVRDSCIVRTTRSLTRYYRSTADPISIEKHNKRYQKELSYTIFMQSEDREKEREREREKE